MPQGGCRPRHQKISDNVGVAVVRGESAGAMRFEPVRVAHGTRCVEGSLPVVDEQNATVSLVARKGIAVTHMTIAVKAKTRAGRISGFVDAVNHVTRVVVEHLESVWQRVATPSETFSGGDRMKKMAVVHSDRNSVMAPR